MHNFAKKRKICFTKMFDFYQSISFLRYLCIFYIQKFGHIKKKQYFCTVFFMVLDLRLSKKVGLS